MDGNLAVTANRLRSGCQPPLWLVVAVYRRWVSGVSWIPRLASWWATFALSLTGGILLAGWLMLNLDTSRPISPQLMRAPAPLEWSGAALEAKIGSGILVDGQLEMQLDGAGRGLVLLPVPDLPFGSYRFMTVRMGGQERLRGAALIWHAALAHESARLQSGADPGPARQAGLPMGGWSAIWLDLDRLDDWSGQIAKWGLLLQGEPGARVTIERLELVPDSARGRLAWLIASWAVFEPWTQRSINSFRGTGLDPPIGHRMPIVVVFLAGSLLTYFALLALRRFRPPLDWRLVASLVLIAWISLDAPWQWKLWRQLGETQATFAGKSQEEKALNGLDAPIYESIRAIYPLLGEPPARVFIATPNEYIGLRAAYRLYPHNPYWRRHARYELPTAELLQSGDFILMLQSEGVRRERDGGALRWGDDQRIRVERLYADPLGELYRVF